MAQTHEPYYVPAQSPWPFVGALALFFLALGAGMTVIHSKTGEAAFGLWVLCLGAILLLFMLVGWFGDQIRESLEGLHDKRLGVSYQQGMRWFIFSEVMFFVAFFGALFYARVIAIPWLDGESNNAMTGEVLWPDFSAHWPLTTTPDGQQTQAMGWMGLPLINTLILLSSSVTLHFSHAGLKDNNRKKMLSMLGLTVALGVCFLILQVEEYISAYQDLGLTLSSGIYGNTFFILTGFHGLHVTLGAVFLFVIFCRARKAHFSPEQHFAFQASSWYWHFVDVVWVCLFVLVYIL